VLLINESQAVGVVDKHSTTMSILTANDPVATAASNETSSGTPSIPPERDPPSGASAAETARNSVAGRRLALATTKQKQHGNKKNNQKNWTSKESCYAIIARPIEFTIFYMNPFHYSSDR